MSEQTPVILAGQETKDQFFHYYQLDTTALQQQIARLESLSTVDSERTDAIDHCLAGIAHLQKEIQDASSYTTAHDQRIYSEGVKALHEKLERARATLMPKSKFTFKSSRKKNNSAIPLIGATEPTLQQQTDLDGLQIGRSYSEESSSVATPANLITPPNEALGSQESSRRGNFGRVSMAADVHSDQDCSHDNHDSVARKLSFTSSDSVNISTHSFTHIIVTSCPASATASGSVTDLRNCILDMYAPTAAARPLAGFTIKHIQQSLLICGNVSGATHITGVEDSVIVVTTRQFRMHQCRDCIIYLNVNSKPMIEDCSGIRFAPLPNEFLQYVKDAPMSNQWDQVQDFKWLKAERSPNWSTLAPEDAAPDETWRNIIPRGPGYSVDDILKAVGVPFPY